MRIWIAPYSPLPPELRLWIHFAIHVTFYVGACTVHTLLIPLLLFYFDTLFRTVSNSQIQLSTTKWCFDWPGMFWYGDRISLLFLKALCQLGSCHNLSKILIYHSSPSIHIVISSHVIHLCWVLCTSFVHWSFCWTQESATSLGKISTLHVSGTTESPPIFLGTSHLTLECLLSLWHLET